MSDAILKKQNVSLLKSDRMSNESIPKLVMRFALTTLTALIFNSIYNLTDALFVSWGVGDNAMGGVSIIFPFIIFQSGIATAVGGGAASLVSRKLGAGQPEEAGEITLNAMLTFYASAIIMTILGFAFMRPLLILFGATADIFNYAKEYFTIILIGNVFSTGFSSIIRAEGKMLYSLLIWVIPISLNIILDAVFILLLGWGVKGSAWATVFCQFSSFLMSVLFFVKFSSQRFKKAQLKLRYLKDIISIGIPSLVQMGGLSIMFFLLNNTLKDIGGTSAIVTFSYMSKIITYAIVPFTAVAQALMPIVGYNFGGGNKKRVQQTISFCLLITFIYSLIALTFFESIPQYMMMIFTKDISVIAAGTKGLKIIGLSLPFCLLPMIIGGFFQAKGNKAASLILYASTLFFIFILILIIKPYLTLSGVWWLYVISNILSALLSIILVSVKNMNLFRKTSHTQ